MSDILLILAATLAGLMLGWWVRGKVEGVMIVIAMRVLTSAIGKKKVAEALARVAGGEK